MTKEEIQMSGRMENDPDGSIGLAQQCLLMAHAACRALSLPFKETSPQDITDGITALTEAVARLNKGGTMLIDINPEKHPNQLGELLRAEFFDDARLVGAIETSDGWNERYFTVRQVMSEINGEMGRAIYRHARMVV